MIESKFENNQAVIGNVESAVNTIDASGVDSGNEHMAMTVFPCTFHC